MTDLKITGVPEVKASAVSETPQSTETKKDESIFEKRSEMWTNYLKEGLAYYKEALADGKIDIEEMAGMPVLIRESAEIYAKKQVEAYQKAEEYCLTLLESNPNIKLSEEQYNALLEKAFKAELRAIQYDETIFRFGIDG